MRDFFNVSSVNLLEGSIVKMEEKRETSFCIDCLSIEELGFILRFVKSKPDWHLELIS